jgi:GAF domain-containing protein
LENSDFILRILPAFVRRSLKAKIASFFVLFALIITIEMIVLSVLRKKALALPKQIELALASEYYTQEARLGFLEFMAGEKVNSEAALNNYETSKHLLKTLINGGKAPEINFVFSPSEGLARSISENLLNSIESIRMGVIEIITKKNSTPGASNETDNLSIEPNPGHITASIIDVRSRSFELRKEFDLLIDELRTEMGNRQGTIAILMIAVLVIDVGVLGLFFMFMSRNISNPLKEISGAAVNQTFSKTKTEDEIGVVASNLNGIINQLNEATTFIEAIGEGKLDETLSGKHDGTSLSQALLSMQQKLKAINDEEQKRKWTTEGLAKFVEILRSGESNVSALGDNIIKALVNYTGSTQGGLYVWNDDQPENAYIQLIASFAYNRKKYDQNKIKAGEGLLGQTYLERATTYLIEIPHDYFRIVSGLGEMDPQSILIVPLLSDDKVYGLVELASLKKFEAHEIAFVEKLGESVASTLASVKANEKTKKLLQDFQEQTQSLRSQEEEMRQNMEELTATQEEMSRKEQDYLKQIDELKTNLNETSSDGKWEIAHQTEQTLKANLKALNIALEELKKSN